VTLLRRCRMKTDDRREQLLRTGVELLGERSYDEVSIDEIARAAGVSKGLLYHYFPTKKDFVVAVLHEASEELTALTAPDPTLDPLAQLDASLDAFLAYVEEHAAAYATIFRTRGGGDPEIQEALERGRRQRVASVVAAIGGWSSEPSAVADSAALQAAVGGWIFFVEGVVLRWLERRDLSREQVRDLLRAALIGAIDAARSVDPVVSLDAAAPPLRSA
jgi:AcrR family transcriptional regulator